MPLWKPYVLLITVVCLSSYLCAQTTDDGLSGSIGPSFTSTPHLIQDADTSRNATRNTTANTDSGATQSHKTYYIVGEVVISGNKRTKAHIIERELPFKRGDSILLPELVKGFEVARQQLITTRLFNEAVVALKSFRGIFVDVLVDVKERWYIFPIPYLKPVDRNLAEWAKQGYATDRLNYGFKFTHYNFSGRNDKLRMWLITGYTKQIQFHYEQPYADETLKHGYKLGFSYATNNEVNYATVNNQQQFTDSLSGTRTWNGHIEYNYRPGLRTFHSLRLSYTHFSVDERVSLLNDRYLKNGFNNLSVPELAYSLKHYHVDYIPYPLQGWVGEATISKRGIHSHSTMWQLGAKFSKAIPLGNQFYFHLQSQGVLRYPFDQPYFNSGLFGYGDLYLRGLERYVVDGVAGLMSRQTFRKHLFTFSLPTFLRSGSHDKIPIRIFTKAFADMGYAYNKTIPDNSLVNRMLYTAGAGIDIVTFYDLVFRFDYSFNQLGQNGLFLHLKNEF